MKLLGLSEVERDFKACIMNRLTTETTLSTFIGPCIVIYSYNKNQRDALFLKFIYGTEIYMFRTGLLPIISSLVLYTQ